MKKRLKQPHYCGADWSETFPTFWVIVLVLTGVWFAGDMGWFGTNFSFPWFTAIIVIIAIAALVNYYKK